MAGLKPRGKSGNYTWYYYTGKAKSRKQHTFATGTNDLPTAILRVREFKDSAYKREIDSDWKQTVDSFIAFKVERGCAEETKQYLQGTLNRFGRYAHGISPSQVTTEMLQEYFASLSASEATLHTYFRALRAFFNWCVKQGHIRKAPTQDVHLPKSKNHARIIFCTPEVRDQLLEAAQDDPDMTFILRCGFDCGLRKKEIINVRRDWIDLDGPVPLLTVRPAIRAPRLRPGEKPFPVKSKARSIPIPAPFADFLKDYLYRDLEPLDFVLKPSIGFGKSNYRYDFRKPFEVILASCGMKDFTTHAMRHTFASIMLMRGAGISEVAQCLGDSQATVEKHYSHLIPSMSKTHLLYS